MEEADRSGAKLTGKMGKRKKKGTTNEFSIRIARFAQKCLVSAAQSWGAGSLCPTLPQGEALLSSSSRCLFPKPWRSQTRGKGDHTQTSLGRSSWWWMEVKESQDLPITEIKVVEHEGEQKTLIIFFEFQYTPSPRKTGTIDGELESKRCYLLVHLLEEEYGEIPVRFGFVRRIFPSCAATTTEISRGAQVDGSWRFSQTPLFQRGLAVGVAAEAPITLSCDNHFRATFSLPDRHRFTSPTLDAAVQPLLFPPRSDTSPGISSQGSAAALLHMLSLFLRPFLPGPDRSPGNGLFSCLPFFTQNSRTSADLEAHSWHFPEDLGEPGTQLLLSFRKTSGVTPAFAPVLQPALEGWETVNLSGVRVKEAKWEHEGDVQAILHTSVLKRQKKQVHHWYLPELRTTVGHLLRADLLVLPIAFLKKLPVELLRTHWTFITWRDCKGLMSLQPMPTAPYFPGVPITVVSGHVLSQLYRALLFEVLANKNNNNNKTE
ncbi:hypothetical protein Q9966_002460 [Columba livia]|nr:hypothetical protein Q9966_002460 [Columba livia]